MMLQAPLVDFNWIFQIIFLVFFMFIYLYGTRLQSYIWQRQAKAGLNQLEMLAKQGKVIAFKSFKDLSVDEKVIKSTLEKFLEFFVIEPVTLDPAGYINRLEHVLDVREARYEEHVVKITPKASSAQQANAEAVLAGAHALYYVFRVVRHFFLLAKKTKSIYYTMQLQMQLPMILQMAKAYFEATRAFADGKPIGDGMGALAVAHFAREIKANDPETVAKHTVAYSGEFEGRTLWFVRAEGPGSQVGKPGEGIVEVTKRNKGKIARIITVDAGLKLEGEDTGQVIEGAGPAIGGAGVEKYKMEISGLKHEIPYDAIVIKESLEDALSPMKKSLIDAVPKVIEKMKEGILDLTEKGDTVIIAGIGNTIGIG